MYAVRLSFASLLIPFAFLGCDTTPTPQPPADSVPIQLRGQAPGARACDMLLQMVNDTQQPSALLLKVQPGIGVRKALSNKGSRWALSLVASTGDALPSLMATLKPESGGSMQLIESSCYGNDGEKLAGVRLE